MIGSVPVHPFYISMARTGVAAPLPWCYHTKYHFSMFGFLLLIQIPWPVHIDYHK